MGVEWVEARYGDRRAYAPLAEFHRSGPDASRRFAENGVVIVGSADWTLLMKEVAQLTKFPIRPLIERPGWSGSHYALPDGKVCSPRGADEPIIMFPPDPLKCLSAGTGNAWRAGVCKPLAGQHLCVFMLMATFAAPLLALTDRTDNFGFELVGDGGIGKSTLQQLMATIGGAGSLNAPGRYWVDCNTTVNALESEMMYHSDQPLILEEAALFDGGGSRGSRRSQMQQLVFKLFRGSTKARYDRPRQTDHRLVYVLSSNKSLAEVLAGGHRSETAAAADRLITLRLDDRAHGIFDFLPAEYASASEYAAALKRTAADNHGLALPRFAKLLVKRRAKDEAALKRWIQQKLHEFRQAAGADPDNGSQLRVVDAFGLSYAAGMLAQEFRILPRAFDCLLAASCCYRLHQRETRPLRLSERLAWIARQPAVIDLEVDLPALGDAELLNIPAFLRTTRQGRREILFTQASRDRFFPDFRELKRDPSNAGLFKSESDRDTVRRFIRTEHDKEPVYRFFMPAIEVDDEDDDLG